MRDGHTSLGQDELNVAQAQAEDVIEPYGVADDLRREAVAGLGCGFGRRAASLVHPSHFDHSRQVGNAN